MNTELFELAAKFRAADDAYAAAEAAYVEAGKTTKAAYGARIEARDRLAKALGMGNAVVVNDECFIADSGYIKIRKLAGWIGVDLAKPKPETDADGFVVWPKGCAGPIPTATETSSPTKVMD